MDQPKNVPFTDGKEKSSIPSNSGSWYYPSRNQFYRTTKKKGYNYSKEELDVALQIHNAVNEETWKRIMKKEQKYFDLCKEQKLIRFIGLPNKLSLKAFMLNLMGYNKPFDRHDWYIDRCGNTIKYIIDYYDGKSDERAPVSIFIDARPQLSVNNMVDYFKMVYIKMCRYFF
ncbi:cytochrome c1 heme lyase, putative [Plasmodium knowlesi strain H]|uniref:Holocytochrome c-type synthase n=3 Tax=Plasmodium knowlesi TaxID=5850 RepID=A0A5K1VCV2_PLAKH|nr:cytochrome c1 heme lyase, putative [Plasmodium knowlesi strain H]OTN66623.1 Cytochrome c heme lyase [Plasmodium knowlesi]CAA9990074.1 cytochrome c1 heme lyase, putative [Plasmodium knowlesi strain H]SBO25738.1 cytochrome c1 heme lyase, putative [Plasmodium knowlesi strain H]SBO28546.1 cytochrome c1 heme lyase, putative [Plasmodium knowlesi strain H]VVS79548.1 cytochrome c1 heme lyase, putative [Plasmodium knowlesi strain H]|eukprot:XP_002260541.1 Cytochrome c1 heme lyase, putative [Plasmodium knowlesi strain H]